MTPNRTRRADAAASVALFGVILALSLALAVWTDLHVVARGAIAIVSGIVAAAVTYAIVSRK
ncbi:hypothetical protein ACFQ0P_06285 [Microbacterium insulae]|uniref:Uncharacterized protein n=1 Tax=Microbacterium insulae TaxID=483014 RepID=A0ABW3AGT4_9MICO